MTLYFCFVELFNCFDDRCNLLRTCIVSTIDFIYNVVRILVSDRYYFNVYIYFYMHMTMSQGFALYSGNIYSVICTFVTLKIP